MISKEGKQYIESMRGYLISHGIKESEIEEFLEEAEVHLIEGEQNGKTIEDIFGKSAKKYAKEIVAVSSVSIKENTKYIINLIIAIFGLTITAILINRPIELSVFELIGYPVSFILWIAFLIIALRIPSFNSKVNEFLLTFLCMLIPSAGTVGVLVYSQSYNETIVTIEGIPRYVIGSILIIAMLINFAVLFNIKFSFLYVILVFGSLCLFEYFKLEQVMYSELRFVLAGILSYLVWRFYGRKILLFQQ